MPVSQNWIKCRTKVNRASTLTDQRFFSTSSSLGVFGLIVVAASYIVDMVSCCSGAAVCTGNPVAINFVYVL